MDGYREDFVTISGEMLSQVRNAVLNLASYDITALPSDIQQSIRVLTSDAFAYRLGVITPNKDGNESRKL